MPNVPHHFYWPTLAVVICAPRMIIMKISQRSRGGVFSVLTHDHPQRRYVRLRWDRMGARVYPLGRLGRSQQGAHTGMGMTGSPFPTKRVCRGGMGQAKEKARQGPVKVLPNQTAYNVEI